MERYKRKFEEAKYKMGPVGNLFEKPAYYYYQHKGVNRLWYSMLVFGYFYDTEGSMRVPKVAVKYSEYVDDYKPEELGSSYPRNIYKKQDGKWHFDLKDIRNIRLATSEEVNFLKALK